MRRDFGDSYQDIVINGKVVEEGRRSALNRINAMPIDFEGKTVLDMGCNVGGMLFAISDKIKYGHGVEGNQKAVDKAEGLVKEYNLDNLKFKCVNIETDYMKLGKYDVGFMLSLANWIKNWKAITLQMKDACDVLIFEAHGQPERQEKQVDFLFRYFKEVRLLLKEAEDGNDRSMFLCLK